MRITIPKNLEISGICRRNDLVGLTAAMSRAPRQVENTDDGASAPFIAWTPPGYSAAESAVMTVGRNHEPGGGRYGCYDGGGGSRKGHFRGGMRESGWPCGRAQAVD